MGDLYGSVEAGGTKFVCAVATGPDDIKDEIRYPTTSPGATINRAIDFFESKQQQHGPIKAIGVGSFGPIDVDRGSATWGYITSTPKPGWKNTNFVGPLRGRFDVPIAWDTDVNTAALGEHMWGAAQGLDTFIYITVGTGFGGGGMAGGQLMHGLVHPEMGHIPVPHDTNRDPYPGRCPFHGDCLEGMVSGPAIEERWGVPSSELPPSHDAWPLEAEYLAHGLRTLVCALSPQRIIMGGGVMEVASLFPLIRKRLQTLLNGYVQHPSITDDIDRYVVPPALGNQAGLLGGIALARRAAERA